MKAYRLIEGADFDPEALKVIYAAFDAAWQEIAGHYDTGNAGQIDPARLQLAHSVLAVASDNGRDAEQLKRATRCKCWPSLTGRVSSSAQDRTPGASPGHEGAS